MRALPLLLILDAHAYAYRAFFAIRQLSSPTGTPTNAIFGFIKMLAKMQESLQPTHMVAVWDGGLAPERLAMLPQYKSQRPAMPDDLARQVDEIVIYLQAARVASLCKDGVEADDWIASLTRQTTEAGLEVIIASSDKDFLQLVSPQVGLLNPNDKSAIIWKEPQVRDKTGVAPGQIVDWLSLIGDSVDNIAGVPGVGPKTATELLGQFHSVDGLYANLNQVKSDRLRSTLRTSESVVRRNQQLIKLKDDLPSGVSLEDLAVQTPETAQLAALYSKWGFKSLAKALAESTADQPDLLVLQH